MGSHASPGSGATLTGPPGGPTRTGLTSVSMRRYRGIGSCDARAHPSALTQSRPVRRGVLEGFLTRDPHHLGHGSLGQPRPRPGSPTRPAPSTPSRSNPAPLTTNAVVGRPAASIHHVGAHPFGGQQQPLAWATVRCGTEVQRAMRSNDSRCSSDTAKGAGLAASTRRLEHRRFYGEGRRAPVGDCCRSQRWASRAMKLAMRSPSGAQARRRQLRSAARSDPGSRGICGASSRPTRS